MVAHATCKLDAGTLTDGSAAHNGNLSLLGRRHLAVAAAGGVNVGSGSGSAGRQS